MVLDKAKKQIGINLVIVVFSVIVIFLSKSIQAGGFLLSIECYLGSDIIFVMITSLTTTVGWRCIEGIHKWGWNVFVFFFLLVLSLIYGLSIASLSPFIIILIECMLIVFLISTFVENLIIFCYFRHTENTSKKKNCYNYLGYKSNGNR